MVKMNIGDKVKYIGDKNESLRGKIGCLYKRYEYEMWQTHIAPRWWVFFPENMRVANEHDPFRSICWPIWEVHLEIQIPG